MDEHPIDALTFGEAAHVLGCPASTVRRHVLAGRLPAGDPRRHRTLARVDVEALTLQVYDHRLHRDDPESYWVTGQRAANILGVNVARPNQLVAKGFLPFEVHADGTRMFWRAQLAIVANAREARWR